MVWGTALLVCTVKGVLAAAMIRYVLRVDVKSVRSSMESRDRVESMYVYRYAQCVRIWW